MLSIPLKKSNAILESLFEQNMRLNADSRAIHEASIRI